MPRELTLRFRSAPGAARALVEASQVCPLTLALAHLLAQAISPASKTTLAPAPEQEAGCEADPYGVSVCSPATGGGVS
jgi:hypothetical protein